MKRYVSFLCWIKNSFRNYKCSLILIRPKTALISRSTNQNEPYGPSYAGGLLEWVCVSDTTAPLPSPPHCRPPPPPPTFCLSALSSVQLFTFSKVIYFQDNLIMSKPTLLCSVTRQDGLEREGGNRIDWLCLAHFTWRADELYGQQLRNHLVRLS